MKRLLGLLAFFTLDTLQRKPTIESLFRDIQFGQFLTSELNYSDYMRYADRTASKLVPFQDTSNDTFYRVGIIHKTQLENYTKIKVAEQLGDIKNKPWLPVNQIKDELANCMQYKYGALSENDFKYDKGLYGWFNTMKFVCGEVNDGFYLFGMAFARTRFRLKQVYLRRQNKYWATSGRSIITRDVQKIVDIFSLLFAEFVEEQTNDELARSIEGRRKKNKNKYDSFVKLTNEAHDALTKFYGSPNRHTTSEDSKAHTFNTIAIPVKQRLMIVHPDKVATVVENHSDDLSDEACETLDSCSRQTCSFTTSLNDTYVPKTQYYKYTKETSLFYRMGPTQNLLVYQSSKPYFKFDTMKRKTSHGIVEVRQHLDKEASALWSEFVEQQFDLAIRMHSQAFFLPKGPSTQIGPVTNQKVFPIDEVEQVPELGIQE